MSLFKSSVEVNQYAALQSEITVLKKNLDEAHAENDKLSDELRELKWKVNCAEREYQLKTEEKLNEVKKSMQESLVKSDILRTEAIAKLEIYEKTDSKADANAIKDMIGKLIEKIGSQPQASINVVK